MRRAVKPYYTLLLGVLLVTAVAGTVMALQKSENPQSKEKQALVLGEDEVKQLLQLMDSDKNGLISKDEFMRFMEAEFNRLDKDKSGMLDPKELSQSRIRVARPVAVGK